MLCQGRARRGPGCLGRFEERADATLASRRVRNVKAWAQAYRAPGRRQTTGVFAESPV
jgi:hypothetical protein